MSVCPSLYNDEFSNNCVPWYFVQKILRYVPFECIVPHSALKIIASIQQDGVWIVVKQIVDLAVSARKTANAVSGVVTGTTRVVSFIKSFTNFVGLILDFHYDYFLFIYLAWKSLSDTTDISMFSTNKNIDENNMHRVNIIVVIFVK